MSRVAVMTTDFGRSAVVAAVIGIIPGIIFGVQFIGPGPGAESTGIGSMTSWPDLISIGVFLAVGTAVLASIVAFAVLMLVTMCYRLVVPNALQRPTAESSRGPVVETKGPSFQRNEITQRRSAGLIFAVSVAFGFRSA